MYEISSAWRYLFQLIKAAVQETEVPPCPMEISFVQIYRLAVTHKVAPILWYAVNRMEQPPSDCIASFAKAHKISAVSGIVQELELRLVTEKMQQLQAPYMFIPPWNAGALYPRSDMRLNTDIELIGDAVTAQPFTGFLAESGYRAEPSEEGVLHYRKEPFVNLTLYAADMPPNGLLRDLWENARWIAGEAEKRLCAEEEYVYLIARMANGLWNRAVGVADVVDLYLYRQSKLVSADAQKVEKLLQEKGLQRFEQVMCCVLEVWFAHAEPDETVACLSQLLMEGFKAEQTEKRGKARRVLRRIFPNAKYMTEVYSWVNNRRRLLPIAWTMRIFTVLFRRFPTVSQQLKLCCADTGMALSAEELKQRCGLLHR